jgi:MFS family permease
VRSSGFTRPLLTVWLGWMAVMASANLAAPLYAAYADRFGFSSLVLTLVFAAYAVVLVPTLMLFGRLSDRFGRRPVLLAGLAAAIAGLVVFDLADATGWLFVARAFQGLAVGMISGTATAALVELDPRRDEGRPAMLAGLAQSCGSGLGPLVAGMLAQWAPDPLRLSYLVGLAAIVVAVGFTLALPEPARGPREPWRPQWPRVPDEIGSDFARVGITAGIGWGALAMSLSIVPSYTAKLLDTGNLALIGTLAALTLAASSVAQVVAQRRRGSSTQRLQGAGLMVLALGLAALVAASPLHSLDVVLAAALAIGVGHGLSFLGAQDELNGIAPGERRGEITSAFVCCIYATVGTAVILSGLLGLWTSLSAAVGIVAGALAVLSVATSAWQVRRAGTTARRRRSVPA